VMKEKVDVKKLKSAVNIAIKRYAPVWKQFPIFEGANMEVKDPNSRTLTFGLSFFIVLEKFLLFPDRLRASAVPGYSL
jgi:hypothetical protein